MDTTITVNEHSIEYIFHSLQFTLDTMQAWAEQELDNKEFFEVEDTLNRWRSYLWAFEDIIHCTTWKDNSRQEQLLAVYKDRLRQAQARYKMLSKRA